MRCTNEDYLDLGQFCTLLRFQSDLVITTPSYQIEDENQTVVTLKTRDDKKELKISLR